MSRVYVGNLQAHIPERDLENVFQVFGVLRSVWVGRRSHGPRYAYVEFDDCRDALNAIETLDGRNGWRVELAHNSRGGRGSRASSEDINCYECGGRGHFGRDCHLRECGGLGWRERSRSLSPENRHSLRYRCRSYSPPGRSPHRHRSGSPYGTGESTYSRRCRGRSNSRSPAPHGKSTPHSSRRRIQN